jgi:hypothetical protein
MSKEELYRQHYLYWKSWHDELIESLAPGRNRKKQLSCAQEAMKNLMKMAEMMNDQQRAQLQPYLSRMGDLYGQVAVDIAVGNISRLRSAHERVRQEILREFSYPAVAAGLK